MQPLTSLMAGVVSVFLLLLGACGQHNEAEAATLQDSQCPLSRAQEGTAVENFKALLPVIRHPRCSNCHGGIDFRSPGYEKLHGGGEVKFRYDGEPDPVTCKECHDAETSPGSGWKAAPEQFRFHGRTAAQICQNIKVERFLPRAFLRHLEKDELVLLAFEGRRGHTDLAPKPPFTTHDEFLTRAERWTDPLTSGGRWLGAPRCGCAPSGWSGTIKYTHSVDFSMENADGEWAVEHLGLLPWTDGFVGTNTLETQFHFRGDAAKGSWTGEGKIADDDDCWTVTSNISGGGTASLSVSDARTGEDWEPFGHEELQARVNVGINEDGRYLIGFRTGDLVGKSTYDRKGKKCGTSSEREDSLRLDYTVEGKVDPANPNVLSGAKTLSRPEGSVTVTWELEHYK
jgi:hypothetical protein